MLWKTNRAPVDATPKPTTVTITMAAHMTAQNAFGIAALKATGASQEEIDALRAEIKALRGLLAASRAAAKRAAGSERAAEKKAGDALPALEIANATAAAATTRAETLGARVIEVESLCASASAARLDACATAAAQQRRADASEAAAKKLEDAIRDVDGDGVEDDIDELPARTLRARLLVSRAMLSHAKAHASERAAGMFLGDHHVRVVQVSHDGRLRVQCAEPCQERFERRRSAAPEPVAELQQHGGSQVDP